MPENPPPAPAPSRRRAEAPPRSTTVERIGRGLLGCATVIGILVVVMFAVYFLYWLSGLLMYRLL